MIQALSFVPDVERTLIAYIELLIKELQILVGYDFLWEDWDWGVTNIFAYRQHRPLIVLVGFYNSLQIDWFPLKI